MALSRIGTSADFAALFARSSYAAAATGQQRSPGPNSVKLHASVVRCYPEAPELPLPSNVSEIFNIETSRFTPERARDIAAPVFLHSNHCSPDNYANGFGFNDNAKMQQLDSHLDSYDCFGAVSLSGTMQTNVPKPFSAHGRSTYMNMPGGQWASNGKYLAEIMRKNHFAICKMRQIKRNGGLDGPCHAARFYTTASTSSSPGNSANVETVKPSLADKGGGEKKAKDAEKGAFEKVNRKERLQMLVRDYGLTVVIFHTVLSLGTLGISYALVSSGLDVTPVVEWFSNNLYSKPVLDTATDAELGTKPEDNELVKNVMSQGSTFLIAYGIHKLFAPVRLTTTIAVTPILVRFLRRRGILKQRTPKPSS